MRRSFMTAMSSSHSSSLSCRRGAIALSAVSIACAGTGGAPVATACISAVPTAEPRILRDERLRFVELEVAASVPVKARCRNAYTRRQTSAHRSSKVNERL